MYYTRLYRDRLAMDQLVKSIAGKDDKQLIRFASNVSRELKAFLDAKHKDNRTTKQ